MTNQTVKRISTRSARLFQLLFALVFVFSLLGVQPAQRALAQTETKVALITDWGVNISDTHKATIAGLINAWDPDAVTTAGDNYHDRSPYCYSYAECIAGYNDYAEGYIDYVGEDRFYPAYGNHDAGHSAAYKEYFSYLPSEPDPNHLYYDVVVGNIHFWFLNGNVSLPGSAQQTWLATNAPLSTAAWNIVIVHQPPYGTGTYRDIASSQLPYQDYDIDFVIGGHNHHYERLVKDDVRYFIAGRAGDTSDNRTCTGTGSAATTEFCSSTAGVSSYGYMQITATETNISLSFIGENGAVVDTWEQTNIPPTDPVISINPTSLTFDGKPGEPSEIKSYTVSGVRLKGNVTITPPPDFEISTASGAGFTSTNPIVLSPTDGTLASTTIYARFNRATIGTSNGNISHTSLDASTRNLAVTGTATQKVIVTFEANGGGVPSMATKEVTVGSTYGPLATISRTGYTFDGWFTAAIGGSRVTAATTVTATSNHMLYAQWIVTPYTVTFNANGGGTPSPMSKTVTYGAAYGELATTSRTGYTFNGWFTAPGGGTVVTAETIVENASNHTLYARWTANAYLVTFNANGGETPSLANKQVLYGSAYGTLATTSRAGATFLGWFTDASGGTQVLASTVVAIAVDHTLYAHWEAVAQDFTIFLPLALK